MKRHRSLANFALTSPVSHFVAVNLAAVNAGRTSAPVSNMTGMMVSEGEWVSRTRPSGRFKQWLSRRRGEVGLERRQLRELAAESPRQRKGLPEPVLVAGKAASRLLHLALLLLPFLRHALQDVLDPGDQSDGRQVVLRFDVLLEAGAAHDQNDLKLAPPRRPGAVGELEAAEHSQAHFGPRLL